MSVAPRACQGCGFEPPHGEARFCERCGLALAAPGAPPPAGTSGSGPTPDAFGDLPARFRALQAHPDLPQLLGTPPDVPELAGKTLPSLLLLLGLTVLGGFAALVCFQLCPPLGFVPLVLVLLGAGAVVRQMLWNARAPLVASPALVVELRARLQPGAEHSHDHARHFVTLELPTGERRERESFASARASLAPGALGVAYEKGERLAAFVTLPV